MKQLTKHPITRHDRGNALEVGDAAAVGTKGDEVAGVIGLLYRHPRLKNSSPKRTFSEPLNVIPGLGDGTRLFAP